MKSILIPTDFSEISKGAIDYAIALSKVQKAKIILLHVFDAGYGLMISQKTQEEEGLRRTRLQVMINEYKDEHLDIEIEGILHIGSLTPTVLDIIQKRKIDLVIMGSKGQTDTHNQAFGSEAAKLIRQSNVPVMTIPKGCQYETIASILYATDYRERDLAVIEQLITLAKTYNAKITILHAEKEKTVEAEIKFRGFESLIESRFGYEHISHELIITESLLHGLSSFANLHDHSIIAASYYKKSYFQSLFKGSIAEGMSYVSKIPLLVYHA